MPTKPIYAYFNALSQLSLDTTESSLISGTVNEDQIYVYFVGKDHANYPTATITFRRSDGVISPELMMTNTSFVYSGTEFPAATYNNAYTFTFYDDWILAYSGILDATIKLYGQNGNILASGKVTLSVAASVNSPETTITPEQYASLLDQISNLSTNNNARKLIQSVRNDDTIQLVSGTVVYVSGTVGGSGVLKVKRADNSQETTSSKTFGILSSTLTYPNGDGTVMLYGLLEGINTSDTSPLVQVPLTAGAAVWLGTNGLLRGTPPTPPNNSVFLGFCETKSNNGSIYVKVQNGYELEELHNVLNSSVQSGDVLRFSNTSLWQNSNALTTAEADIDQLQTDVLALDSIKADITYVDAHKNNTSNPHSVTKAQVGLGNVDNTSDLNKPISTATQTALNLKADSTTVTSALAGKADLISGKVPASQLPSYVDDVVAYISLTTFYGLGTLPLASGTNAGQCAMVGSTYTNHSVYVSTFISVGNYSWVDSGNYLTSANAIIGGVGKIFVDISSNKTYRWNGAVSGTTIVEISESLALGETASTAYRGDRGKTAYDHTFLTDNPHSVTKTQVGLSNVDNVQQIPLSQKGAVGGVASLDSNGQVHYGQLPVKVVDDVIYLLNATIYEFAATLPTNTTPGRISIFRKNGNNTGLELLTSQVTAAPFGNDSFLNSGSGGDILAPTQMFYLLYNNVNAIYRYNGGLTITQILEVVDGGTF